MSVVGVKDRGFGRIESLTADGAVTTVVHSGHAHRPRASRPSSDPPGPDETAHAEIALS